MNTTRPTDQELAAAADVLQRFAASEFGPTTDTKPTATKTAEPEDPPDLFPDEITEDELLDEYCVNGVMIYNGYWLAFGRRCDDGKAAAAVYGYDGAGGLDKLLEVNGAITTGAAVRAAMDVVDNVGEDL